MLSEQLAEQRQRPLPEKAHGPIKIQV